MNNHYEDHHPYLGHVRSGWNTGALLRGKRLTDKRIAHYERLGYYTAEYREARKALMEKKARKRMTVRDGNFNLTGDGRMIYNPL